MKWNNDFSKHPTYCPFLQTNSSLSRLPPHPTEQLNHGGHRGNEEEHNFSKHSAYCIFFQTSSSLLSTTLRNRTTQSWPTLGEWRGTMASVNILPTRPFFETNPLLLSNTSRSQTSQSWRTLGEWRRTTTSVNHLHPVRYHWKTWYSVFHLNFSIHSTSARSRTSSSSLREKLPPLPFQSQSSSYFICLLPHLHLYSNFSPVT